MKLLITDMLHTSIAQELAVCDKYGCELDTTFCHSEEDLIRNGKNADGFLVSYSQITRKVISSLPNLKVVVKYGIGVDNIDVQAATDYGVMVGNVPDYCLEEVASHALMLILTGLKQTPHFIKSIQNKFWDTTPGDKILYRPSEISLGLISFGRISRQLARYAKPLFKEICFYDPYVQKQPELGVIKVETLEEIFERCTVISVHTPLTKDTKYLINTNLVRKASKAILVNTSRGLVVDPDSIEFGLENGNLVFFGADTFWSEPPNFDSPFTQQFLARPNVLITPHCGWCSLASERDVRWKAAETAILAIKGELTNNILNKNQLRSHR